MTGEKLIGVWVKWLRRYVVLSEEQALVCVLWAVNTWVYDRFAAVPFLEIVASAPESGKSTLLKCLRLLSRNAEYLSIVRILTVLRMIEASEGKTTILIDEAEQFARPNLGELRAGMASGYQKGASHAITSGKGFQRFRTFAPWAFAQIGNVHEVLRSRCIEIELYRGRPELSFTDDYDNAKGAAAELVAELVLLWAEQMRKHGDRLPVVSADWLHGREREIWTPIWSCATFLGLSAETMRTLQRASVDLGAMKDRPAKHWNSAQERKVADDTDAAETCLADVRAIFAPSEHMRVDLLECTEGKVTGKCIETAALVDALRAIEIRPWRVWNGEGLNEITLAALLARYGLAPVQVRIKLPKGVKALPGKLDNRASVYRLSDLAKVKA